MFKKLKDKIAEEVKQSPQRIQQIAQAAQAAVSSTPAGPSPEVSSGDQFFSITEEDTPQNSPLRTIGQATGKSNTEAASATLRPTTTNNGLTVSPHQPHQRQRRLSNSSMASDVSFRLPAYDSPAVYHLQSDLDCSASEFEDTASNAGGPQLDRISKEQLHSAYKKATDRYQKYRSRYTEIAARYRDLERDNNKARAVLVETQDKALQRIGELREQCSLEQQAKAHLESALRLEMDEMQCVIKTLNSKLASVSDDSSDSLQVNGNSNEDALDRVVTTESTSAAPLLDFSDDSNDKKEVTELKNKIKSLEEVVELYQSQIAQEQQKHEDRNKDVNSLEEKVQQLNDNLNASIEKIKGLQSREEENTILLAENKMMVHSELEAKDEEVKNLRERIQQLETLQSQAESENKTLQTKVSGLSSQISDLESIRHDKEVKLGELEAAKIKLKEEAARLDTELATIKTEKDSLLQRIEDAVKNANNLSAELADEKKKQTECVDKMESELLEVKTQLKLKDQELTEQLSKINSMEKERQQRTKDEKKEVAVLIEQIKALQESIARLNDDNQKLTDEIKVAKVINENSESEAIQSLQVTMTRQLEESEAKLKAKDDQIADLNKQIHEYETKSEALNSEWDTLKKSFESHEGEMVAAKGKIETLRNEKRDLEKTLEKEIRDKNELQIQVTNILQEISRLEEQLNESRESHAAMDMEKSQLQERLENLEGSVEANRMSADSRVIELEERLREAEEIRKELADSKDQLQEELLHLERLKSEAEDKFKIELEIAVAELEELKLSAENAHSDQVKLKECLEENTALLLEKERLEQALRTIEDQMELKEKEKLCVLDTNSSLQKEIDAGKRQVFVLNDQVLGLEQQLLAATEKSAELDEQLAEIKRDMEESSARVKTAEEERQSSAAEVERLQKELAEIEYRHKRANEETQRGKSELEKELKDVENIKVENEYLNTHVKQLDSDLQKLRDETVQRESLLRELKDKYNFAENEMSSLQEQKSKFDCLMADKNDELDQTNVQLATVRQELENIRVTHKTQMNNVAEELKGLKSEISAKQIIINDLNQDLSRQEKELGQAKTSQSKELDELQRANEELKRELKELAGNSTVLEELRTKCEDWERVNQELRLKVVELETSLQDNVVKQSQLTQEHSTKSGEMEELVEENETLKLKFHNLEKTLNSKLAVLDEKHRDLIEENRTLKQAQQSSGASSARADVVDGWEQEKVEMEQRLQKIIAEVQEVSNRNMFLEQKCENFLVLEQANERMKLANDKLSRQLDETLVSMHHNEGIAANTEFEYLKNIMFQYLSGSMNSNSSTLVKVISAVLKFTPQQTQVVLEKENHRHTLLGQINKML